MCTIVIEALMPLDRTLRIKLYKNNARPGHFCTIAERCIIGTTTAISITIAAKLDKQDDSGKDNKKQ